MLFSTGTDRQRGSAGRSSNLEAKQGPPISLRVKKFDAERPRRFTVSASMLRGCP